MWLREQLARYEQLQQNLQSILAQKQQVDIENAELEKAISELKKAGDEDQVYKSTGTILIRAKKEDLLKELTDRKELSQTRSTVLSKQEQRVRDNIKELQAKLEESVKSKPSTSGAPSVSSASSSSQ